MARSTRIAALALVGALAAGSYAVGVRAQPDRELPIQAWAGTALDDLVVLGPEPAVTAPLQPRLADALAATRLLLAAGEVGRPAATATLVAASASELWDEVADDFRHTTATQAARLTAELSPDPALDEVTATWVARTRALLDALDPASVELHQVLELGPAAHLLGLPGPSVAHDRLAAWCDVAAAGMRDRAQATAALLALRANELAGGDCLARVRPALDQAVADLRNAALEGDPSAVSVALVVLEGGLLAVPDVAALVSALGDPRLEDPYAAATLTANGGPPPSPAALAAAHRTVRWLGALPDVTYPNHTATALLFPLVRADLAADLRLAVGAHLADTDTATPGEVLLLSAATGVATDALVALAREVGPDEPYLHRAAAATVLAHANSCDDAAVRDALTDRPIEVTGAPGDLGLVAGAWLAAACDAPVPPVPTADASETSPLWAAWLDAELACTTGATPEAVPVHALVADAGLATDAPLHRLAGRSDGLLLDLLAATRLEALHHHGCTPPTWVPNADQ